jgi:hypothetical protein
MLLKLRPFNIIDRNELPEVTVNKIPVCGDPLEINSEMYFVCETNIMEKEGFRKIGVIPLVVKNLKKVENIESYLKYLSIAHKRIQYRDENNI